jgi:hypothetical protein
MHVLVKRNNKNYTSKHHFISISQETQPKATEGLRICNTQKININERKKEKGKEGEREGVSQISS